ncbi:MAG: hypothetical protein RMJ60_09050 [Anaerolineales bacterium]|nr:hypothetical protein [Anaerolineales bacterium]
MFVDLQALAAFWFGFEAALYGVVAFLIARRHTNLTALTFIYMFVAALMSLLEAARLVGWLSISDIESFLSSARWITSVFLAGVMLFLTRRFVNAQENRLWWAIAGAWGIVLLVLFSLVENRIARLLVAAAAWLTFLSGTILVAWSTYHRTTSTVA